MALFGSKKKKEAKPAEAKTAPVRESGVSVSRDLTQVLKHARITEKASMQQAMNVYTFDIGATATKRDIMQAVKKVYSVTPKKVAVVTVRSKNVRNARTGKPGVKSGGRKAYVYLKKGDAITF